MGDYWVASIICFCIGLSGPVFAVLAYKAAWARLCRMFGDPDKWEQQQPARRCGVPSVKPLGPPPPMPEPPPAHGTTPESQPARIVSGPNPEDVMTVNLMPGPEAWPKEKAKE
jgi:hypothetical protein